MKINRIHFAAAAAGSALALAVGLGHGAVSVAQPNNGGGWDKDGFLYCLQMQPPDTNPHDWAVACCIQNGGHPTDDGTCHPPDGNTPRPRPAQILAPATITPKLSIKVSP